MFDYKHSYAKPANLGGDPKLAKLLGTVSKMGVQIDSAKDKEVVLVIGSTGAGKSTFINYLAGRKMKLDTTQMDDVVVCDNPLAEIGHGMKSHTDRPQLYQEPGSSLILCDCPGFFDNRGLDVEVANAIGIQSLAKNSKLVKGIILIVDRASFLSGRGQTLELTIQSTLKFLGPNLGKNLDSVMMLISKVPNEKIKPFYKAIHDDASMLPLCSEILKRGNVGFYSPLDDLSPVDGVFNRGNLLSKINKFKGIHDSENTFNISVSPSAELEITGLMSLISSRVRSHLNKLEFEPLPDLLKLAEILAGMRIDRVQMESEKMETMVIDQIKLFEFHDKGAEHLSNLKKIMPTSYEKTIVQTLMRVQERVEKEKKIAAEAKKTQIELESSRSAINDLTGKQKTLQKDLESAKISQQEYEKQNKILQDQMSKTTAAYAATEKHMEVLKNELSDAKNEAVRTREFMQQQLSEAERRADERIKSLQSELEKKRDESSNSNGESIIFIHPALLGGYPRFSPMGGCGPRFY